MSADPHATPGNNLSNASLPPNENLPPVEPPGAGSIVQLIIIPAIIVGGLVMVWTLLGGLNQEKEVDMYLRTLERDTPARWQAAMSLSEIVRTSGDGGIRLDEDTAAKLRNLLDRELTTGRTDEQALRLRSYLCGTLGEFRVPGLLPVLIKVADSGTTEDEKKVRFAAVRAIAVYVESNPAEVERERKPLLAVVDKAADDEEPLMRSTAAFAFGAIHLPEAQAGLLKLLHDTTPDVRYNAALTLARRGDPAAVDVLVEMLDPKSTIGLESEKDEKLREAKQVNILSNALRAAEALAKAKPTADLAKLRAAIDKLAQDASVSPVIKVQAVETAAAFAKS